MKGTITSITHECRGGVELSVWVDFADSDLEKEIDEMDRGVRQRFFKSEDFKKYEKDLSAQVESIRLGKVEINYTNE